MLLLPRSPMSRGIPPQLQASQKSHLPRSPACEMTLGLARKTLLDSLPTERPLQLTLERTPPRQPPFYREETPRPATQTRTRIQGAPLTSWAQ